MVTAGHRQVERRPGCGDRSPGTIGLSAQCHWTGDDLRWNLPLRSMDRMPTIQASSYDVNPCEVFGHHLPRAGSVPYAGDRPAIHAQLVHGHHGHGHPRAGPESGAIRHSRAHAIAEGLWMPNIGLYLVFSGSLRGTLDHLPPGGRAASSATRWYRCSSAPFPWAWRRSSTAFLPSASRTGAPPRWRSRRPCGGLTWPWRSACGVLVPFLMFTRQDHSIEKMTAVWLLPVVAAEVAAVSGGLLVPHLADPQAALRMLALGYALWGFSVPLAMGILVILVSAADAAQAAAQGHGRLGLAVAGTDRHRRAGLAAAGRQFAACLRRGRHGERRRCRRRRLA